MGGEKGLYQKALCPILLTGSNPKKPLTQNNVNKDHVFIKKKKLSPCVPSHQRANFIFSGYPTCHQENGQRDR